MFIHRPPSKEHCINMQYLILSLFQIGLGSLGLLILCMYPDFRAHLLDPRSRREFAFDMPVGGENVIGDEKPERGSPANQVGSG